MGYFTFYSKEKFSVNILILSKCVKRYPEKTTLVSEYFK